MATFTQQITDTNQDGESFSATWQSGGMGSGFSSGSAVSPGARFTSVTIPQGATITNATLSVVQRTTSGTPTSAIVGKWFGDKVANAAAWGSSSRPDQITPTTASTQIQFGTNGSTFSHDVTAIVQELVNQGSWASGNAMRLAGLTQTGSGTNQVVFYDVTDASSSGKTATLSVTYTTATTTTITADKGSYTLTGKTASFALGMAAGKGSYALTGKDAALTIATIFTADKGGYSLTGKDAALTLSTNVVLSAGKGSYALTGKDAAFLISLRLAAEKGRYTLIGKSATLTASGIDNSSTATILRVPVTAGNIVDWVRKCATSVNQLISWREQQQTPFLTALAAPSNPVEGQTYYDLALHKVFTWDGSVWRAHW